MRSRHAIRLFWSLLAMAFALWAVFPCTWLYYEVLGNKLPYFLQDTTPGFLRILFIIAAILISFILLALAALMRDMPANSGLASAVALATDRLRSAVKAGKSAGWDWDVKGGKDQRFGDLQSVIGIPSDTYPARALAGDALTSLSGLLIEAQEKERRRIAREIHDDYNQRLAVVAIDLEELAGNLANKNADVSKRLYELWSEVSELGSDLHALSHRLHSSTLDSLGLVAGIRAFCEEFTDQQGVAVDFAYADVPHNIPREASLCLFRIVQESLRNIKKHSGAARAEVRLELIEEKLHLSVSDQGAGFDIDARSAHDGIGIRSMEERLRLQGGTLQIHTRTGEGTRIDAWLHSAVEVPMLELDFENGLSYARSK